MIETTKPRKTFDVNEFRTYINGLLINEKISEPQKSILCSVLERILMDSNNYRGFNYVDWLDHGFNEWKKDGEPEVKTKYYGPEYKRHYH